jgi:hypothetical protein
LHGVSLGYFGTAWHLTDAQREAVRAHPNWLASFHHRRRELTDSEIDKLVARVGADRLLSALDRVTAPIAAQ